MIDYIRTYTGKKLHCANPQPEEICIEDIAHGLSAAPRWGGQCGLRYTVAAHSIYCYRMVPTLAMLLHDASEAYFCDIPAPFKVLLPDYKKVENKIMTAIATRFDFSWPLTATEKAADAAALYIERLLLFDFPNDGDVPSASAPWPEWMFKTWSQYSEDTLEALFLSEFRSQERPADPVRFCAPSPFLT